MAEPQTAEHGFERGRDLHVIRRDTSFAPPAESIKIGKGWWSVDRASFKKAIGETKNVGAEGIFRKVFEHDETPDALSVIADESHHALNAKQLGPPGMFIYESQQYSARVRVDMRASGNEPLQAGRRSFVWPHLYESL